MFDITAATYLLAFILIVLWLLMSYKNLGNIEFGTMLIFLVKYVMYLQTSKHPLEYFVVQEENKVVQEEVTQEEQESSDVCNNIETPTPTTSQGTGGAVAQIVSMKMIKPIKSTICENWSKFQNFSRQFQRLPGEIKTRIGSDFDRMINEAAPKTPSGGYVDKISFDTMYFNTNKDAQLSNADPEKFKDSDIFKKTKQEYKICDTVLRDLYYVNPTKYKAMFYP